MGPNVTRAAVRRLDLTPLMKPASIGLIGVSATRRTRGTIVLENLISAGYAGGIYPINSKYDSILDRPCYPSITSVPERLDALVLAVPNYHVPELLQEAWGAGTRSAVILSSGFQELGEKHRATYEAVQEIADQGMIICGPNCKGVVNIADRVTMFSGEIVQDSLPGPIAIISQSGGFASLLATALTEDRDIGCAFIVSCGNQVGAKVEDYLEYCLNDDHVRVAACYVESFTDVRRVIEIGHRARTAGKHIVVLTVGRSDAAAQAAASHTGALAGEARVVEALLRSAGVVQARDMDELIEIATLLSVAHSEIEPEVILVSGGGGELGVSADAASDVGLTLPEIPPATARRLASVLPSFAHVRNPLDLTGAMYEDPSVFPAALSVLAETSSAQICVNFSLRRRDEPSKHSRQFINDIASLPNEQRARICVYSSSASDPVDEKFVRELHACGVPVLRGTHPAMNALARVAFTRAASSVPVAREVAELPDTELATLSSAWSIVGRRGLNMARLEVVMSEDAAVRAAHDFGGSVALKLATFAISHKSDVGGVRLGVTGEQEVRNAYRELVTASQTLELGSEAGVIAVQEMVSPGLEMFLGITRDAALGPAVVVGFGGVYAEVSADTVVLIPPIGRDDAREALERLRGWPILAGIRASQPYDVDALINAMRALGELAAELPSTVRAVDINPLVLYRGHGGGKAIDLWIDLATR